MALAALVPENPRSLTIIKYRMFDIFLMSAKKGLFSIYTFISDKILPYAISPNFIENNGMNDTIY